MNSAAKRESIAMKQAGCNVYVNHSERACVNCAYYEQYFRKNRGNIDCMVPTSSGYCLLHQHPRGALRQPCGDFERSMKGCTK